MLIAGERVARLKERQLAALERWVGGGGSLFIAPEGALGEETAAFLRRLGGDGEALVDQAGRLEPTASWPRMLRVGLGRAVVAPLSVALDPAREAAFAEVPAFLWKLRAEPSRRLSAGQGCDFTALGKLDHETQEHVLGNANYANGVSSEKSGEERPSFRAMHLPLSGSLTNLLLPSRVTIIPFSVVLMVFAAFVLAVGPGDWFLLGWLRARRFTWIVFPLVAVAFTLLMVRLSRHYLGGADHRQRLELVDCGHGGEVLRDAGIELVFSGHRGEIASDLRDALWADLGRGETENQYGYYRQQQRDTQSVDSVPAYDGSLPGRYLVAQQVGQWDPRLRRTLSFDAPAGLPLRLDRELSLADLPAYADELVKAHGELVVAYWREGKMIPVHGSVDQLGERARTNGRFDGQRDWLGWLCSHPQLGWFSLAAQVSPSGGASFEDFAVHDATDPGEWLLVVGMRQAEQVWVVRRLYRDDGKGNGP